MIRNPVILILLTPHEPALAELRREFPHAEFRLGPYHLDPQAPLDSDLLRGVDIMFCEIPPANFAEFDRLRWIQIASVGYTQLLPLALHEGDIVATNARGIFDVPIAEWNLMMILVWHRRLLELLANQRAGQWDRDASFQAELRGRRVGFWGYGGIARETTRLLKQMGLEVWAMTRSGRAGPRGRVWCLPGVGDPGGIFPDRVFGPDQVETFLGDLDYLVLSMPLTDTTRGMIGERELRMLKPSAVLLNPARAQLIEEEVFIRCLTEGWIRGCALDVHYSYPCPPEHPIWRMDNLIVTPHISGSSAGTHFLARIYDIFRENLEHFLQGEPLLNELTVDQLAGR